MANALAKLPPSLMANKAARNLATTVDKQSSQLSFMRRERDELEDKLENTTEVAQSRYSPLAAGSIAGAGAFGGGVLNGVFKSSRDDMIRPSDVLGLVLVGVGTASGNHTLQLAGMGPLIAASANYGEKAGGYLADGAIASAFSGMFGGDE